MWAGDNSARTRRGELWPGVLAGLAPLGAHPRLVLRRVSLPEEPPSAPPQNVIASGRTNQSIMIQWQPPPESHQNGVIKGYIIR